MANTSLHENAPHLSVTEARQGQRGRHILLVLIASVVLTAIVLALAWGWKSGDLRRAEAGHASSIAASSPQVTRTAPAPLTGPGAPVANDLSK